MTIRCPLALTALAFGIRLADASTDSLLQAYVDGLKGVVPQQWEVWAISDPDSLVYPDRMYAPLFNICLRDTVDTNYCPYVRIPALTLAFYSEAERDTVSAMLRFSQFSSICPGTMYQETPQYFMVTGPCMRFGGCSSAETRALLAPLDSLVKAYFGGVASGVRAKGTAQAAKRQPCSGGRAVYTLQGRQVGAAGDRVAGQADGAVVGRTRMPMGAGPASGVFPAPTQ